MTVSVVFEEIVKSPSEPSPNPYVQFSESSDRHCLEILLPSHFCLFKIMSPDQAFWFLFTECYKIMTIHTQCSHCLLILSLVYTKLLPTATTSEMLALNARIPIKLTALLLL